MEQTQLVELIKSLQAAEKENFLQYAQPSCFPGVKIKPHVASLLRICFSQPWQDSAHKLEKKDVFSELFPGAPYLEGKLEKLMVEAHRLIRVFLLAENYFREDNAYHQAFDYAEIVRTRGFNARYRNQLLKLQKMQDAVVHQHSFFFHDQFLLEYAIHNEQSLNNQIKGDLNIPATLDALDMHHYLNQLALLNVYLLQQKIANIEVPVAMQERLQETRVPNRYLDRSPIILINHTIFTLLKKDLLELEDLQILSDQLYAHEKRIDLENLNAFFTYLRNICSLIAMQQPDRQEIYLMLFDLYKDNLERGFLHYEGKLLSSRYLAISECATRVKEHDWALNFIETYKHEIIGENENQDIYRFNKAFYLFSVGKFEECLDYIPATSPFLNYFLAGKNIELKALYETNSDLLPYKIDAYKMYLSRTSQKQLPAARRKKNLDFVNLLFQICTSIPGDVKRAKLIIERIEEKKQAVDWHWLMAKAEALKKKWH